MTQISDGVALDPNPKSSEMVTYGRGKHMPLRLYKKRHSLAHVMAEAVLDIVPQAKPTIGPPVEHGFYYDFAVPRPFTPEDLERIEGRMREIVDRNVAFERREVSEAEARALFRDNPFKLELIDGLAQGADEYGAQAEDGGEKVEGDEQSSALRRPLSAISIYTQDGFADLCRGPHVNSTGEIAAGSYKLVQSSGAYWRGDESKPMLQRIYGLAFDTKEELETHLKLLEEIERRDHRRLGQDLDLFHVDPLVGPGLVLWHPKGALVRHVAEDFCKAEHLRQGYEFVVSPHIGRSNLWQTSGHLDFFKENMYAAIEMEDGEYYAKPMNCPFHIMIYKHALRSYRDLPIRYVEWGTVYRYERGGTLHGLLRVRGLTQDDAHIFCRPDQMPEEIDRVLAFCLDILRAFGFEGFAAYLSTRPDKAVGDPAKWDAATAALRAALERANMPYEVDEGGGAFYGPKIDLKIRDALGREWQCSTIQFDFNLPERFGMEYIGEDGRPHQPYMVHRALLGSMERFFGVLIEHYGGAFPLWLAPVQTVVIPIAARHAGYAREIAARLRDAGLRAEADESDERMQNKIRKAQEHKVPYMLVVGDRERAAGAVSVRLRTGEDLRSMPLEAFVARTRPIIEGRSIGL